MVKMIIMLLGGLVMLVTLSGCHYFVHSFHYSYSYHHKRPHHRGHYHRPHHHRPHHHRRHHHRRH